MFARLAAGVTSDASFHAAGTIDEVVPVGPRIYAIRLKKGSTLPEPFESFFVLRTGGLIYIGKAASLRSRMLGNELRGRGHGTFFGSIGAALGYRPLAGSLATRVNKYLCRLLPHVNRDVRPRKDNRHGVTTDIVAGAGCLLGGRQALCSCVLPSAATLLNGQLSSTTNAREKREGQSGPHW